jgi:hypothetical protein
MLPLICDAIRARRLLMFGYGNRVPIVEPHLYGVNALEHEVLSAWLLPGHSRADPRGGWRTYLVAEMRDVQILDQPFADPRPDYNPDDTRMVRTFCRLEHTGDR